jgi:hypothetical protein
MARQLFLTYLANVSVGIVELNAELQLVPNFDPLGVRVLQTPGKRLRHVQIPGKLVSLRRFVDDLEAIICQLMFVGEDGSGDFVSVANGVGIFRIEGQVVALDQL